MVWQRCYPRHLGFSGRFGWPFRRHTTVSRWSSIKRPYPLRAWCNQLFLFRCHLRNHRNGWRSRVRPGCVWPDTKSSRYAASIILIFQGFDIYSEISASSLSIFRPGSTSPSAILFDAWESFSRKSPKADESIRSIRPELAQAVDECIDAAGQEWEPYWQRRLLNVCRIVIKTSLINQSMSD